MNKNSFPLFFCRKKREKWKETKLNLAGGVGCHGGAPLSRDGTTEMKRGTWFFFARRSRSRVRGRGGGVTLQNVTSSANYFTGGVWNSFFFIEGCGWVEIWYSYIYFKDMIKINSSVEPKTAGEYICAVWAFKLIFNYYLFLKYVTLCYILLKS